MTGEARTYRLYPLAEADLEDIWRYTVRVWSVAQAERYHGEIVAAFEGVAKGERLGRLADIREGYFKYLIGAHVIFYRAEGDGIDIVRVLHQRMDVSRHL